MIEVGMTINEVYKLIGEPYNISINVWDEDGPYMEYVTWIYKEYRILNNESIYSPQFSRLFFKSNILSGWDIISSRKLPVFIGEKDPLATDIIISVGSSLIDVYRKFGTPSKLIPTSWDALNNMQTWTYRDEYDNEIITFKFNALGTVEVICE